MIIAAAALTAAISIDIDLNALVRRKRVQEPTVTCNIKTVGYRFIGRPGQTFRYAGDTYSIPRGGAIELIAERKKASYEFNNQTLSADVEAHDQFGFRDVYLPKGE
jgi:hypothetical protein